MTLEHFDTILAFVLIITGVSLLITALNQMVSAFLGLRGTHLRWGIKTLLANVDPNLKDHAEAISQQVLGHQLISDSTFSRFGGRLLDRWRLASALSKKELMDVLRLLATTPPSQAPGTHSEAWAKALPALQKSLEELDPQAGNDVVLVATEMKKLFPNDPDKAEKLLAPLMDSAATLTAKIDQWFDTVMGRSSQRFALHMRIWTVVFAIIIAFGMQLDAFNLFTRLSSDAELRARVVTSAEAVTKKADEILVVSTNGSSAVYVLAMKQLMADHTNELKQLAEPVGFTTLAGGKDWLAAELKKCNVSDPENKWAQAYVDQLPQAPLRSASENLHSLLADKLIFEFVPSPYPDPIYKDWSPKSRTFWGLVASAVLLSLGAPFWFNVLKTLSNLRPALASKQDANS
jgi:hypothetical protein